MIVFSNKVYERQFLPLRCQSEHHRCHKTIPRVYGKLTLAPLTDGPGVANIVGHALSSGRKAAFAAIAGAVAGNMSTLLVSLAGVGTFVQAYPSA